MGMFIRTIGLARATMKIGLANSHLQHETNDLADGRACNSMISPQCPLTSQTGQLRRSRSERKTPHTSAATSPHPTSPLKTTYLEVSSW